MKKKLCVLASDKWFQAPEVREELEALFEVTYRDDAKLISRNELVDVCRSAEVVLLGRSSPLLPDELAENFGLLRYACYCHGSIRACVSKLLIERGLVVTNWGNAVEGVAESAMTLLLAMLKQVKALDRHICSGWKDDRRIYQSFPCTLRGLNVGLYGYGPIGKHMGAMLEAFSSKVAIYDPYAMEVPAHVRRCQSLRELFSTCQAVSIHCGLNDQTQKSVTGELLDLLPQGGILINTARGAIVVESALAERVAVGRILAGLDVLENEKAWDSSPLASLPGSLLTGHVLTSGKGFPPTERPAPKLPDYVRKNLAAYVRGEPLINVVSAAQYDLKT